MTSLDCMRLPGQPEPILWGVGGDRLDMRTIAVAISRHHADSESLKLILMDNVADYFWDNVRDSASGPSWNPSTFPNLAPPFHDLFLDYHFTKKAYDVLWADPEPCRILKRIGGRFQAFRLRGDPLTRRGQILRGGGDLLDWDLDVLASAEWIVFLTLFICFQDKPCSVYGPGPITCCLVKQDGTPVGRFHLAPMCGFTDDVMTSPSPVYPDTTIEEMVQPFSQLLLPMWFCISLLHCKNTILEEVSPPSALSKKWERMHGTSLVRYEILNIRPVREVLRSTGRIEEHGLEKAMHICRGHFKDYREHGLFGKQKEVFWWDQHVRGKLEHGLVVKDYQVKRP